jgi:aldehyde:ferredoxin oxidoreductase
MTEKLGKREGFGDIIADGVKKAAERIGKGSEKYAMQIGGEEIPAHDSRGGIGFAIGYGAEPAPARHTQSGEGPLPPGALPDFDRESYKGRGAIHKIGACITQVYNASGVCMIVLGDGYGHFDQLIEALQVITGWDITREELIKTGERIDNIRQAFNIREGLKTPWKYPDRMLGKPPKKVGPRKGQTIDESQIYTEYYQALDWDLKTGKPSKKKLQELGLADVATVLYP